MGGVLTARQWTPALLLLGAAVPVVVLAGALSGALDPLVIGDPGPFVRYGIPLVRVVHDAAAAATVGLLLVGGFLTPEARTSARRETAARTAAATAAVWLVTTLVGLVLAFADVSGLRVSEPAFWAELRTNAWPLELTRLMIIESGLVAVTAVAALVSRTRGQLAWSFALAVASLVPLSFAGHASGEDGHEQAVTGMFLHLLGVTAWVGGLLAILLLRPALGRALPVVVQRFSTVALWSLVAVGGSGVLFALVMAAEPADLRSSYFAVVLAKVGGLVVLAWFGWTHRRRVIARGVDRPGAFARLAAVELAVMGAVVALGVALSRTPPPEVPVTTGDPALDLTGYPMPPPLEWSSWLTVWQPVWLFLLAAVLAVGLYLAGVVRLRRRGDAWPVGRTVLWVLGWVVFTYAVNGAPGVYGRVMFSMHMVMHMALMMAVPILLVPGAAVTLALRALPARRDRTLGSREVLLAAVQSRWASFVVNPVVAGVVFFGSLVVFYWTGLFGWALTTHAGHVAMVVHFGLTGYAFVWSLIGIDPGPRKWPAPMRVLVLFATLASHAFFGLALMEGSWLLAPEVFKALDVPWVEDLLADQRMGGQIAWGVGELPTMVLALLVVRDWVRSDTRDAVRSDRQADRDDDAELAAYNAHLAELAARGRRPQ